MTHITGSDLAQEIRTQAAQTPRLLVAIVGPPGAGKSTLSNALETSLGPDAAVVPMDGFHLENDALIEMGLLNRKGAPQTFDVAGFVELVKDIRTGQTINYPTFDRAADKTVPGGGRLDASKRIILIEGNYLLLDQAPWTDLGPLFDITVQIEVPLEELERRLIARWLDHGLSAEAARARALGNDIPNATLVVQNSRPADFMVAEQN